MGWYNNAKFSDLEGKILSEIIGDKNSEELIFITTEGEQFKMYHSQNCCESVSIDDIVGDLNDLVGSPIIAASEDSNSDLTEEQLAEKERKKLEQGEDYYDWSDDSFTWTFYNISTIKGHVTIRWYGSSNGYYSESVDFEKITNDEDDDDK